MSDPDQNTPPGTEQGGEGAEAPLLFRCGNCGKELTAPVSVAGVEAPCPICGIPVRAPSLEEAEGVEPVMSPEEAPLMASEVPSPSTPERDAPPATSSVPSSPAPSPSPERSGRSSRRRRSIDPSTGFSSSYEDRKEVGALVRIFLAVLCTAAIALSVFFFVKKKFQEPPPEPDFAIPLNH